MRRLLCMLWGHRRHTIGYAMPTILDRHAPLHAYQYIDVKECSRCGNVRLFYRH